MQTAVDIHTYSLLPEWAPQSAVMLTWPHQETIWAEMLDEIDVAYTQIVAAITLRQQVIITCHQQDHRQHVMQLLKNADIDLNQVHCYLSASDDVWVRDHGPITVMRQGKPCLLNFTFNGWGNKYPADNDNRITANLHSQHAFGRTAIKSVDMVLEGGAVEVDGHGTLLTTSSCLLAPSRNPHLHKQDIEKHLTHLFGLKRILWLDHGDLAGDDTDGHIDTLARFVDANTICYVSCDDPDDEHYAELQLMEQQLKSFTDYQGKPYQLIALPMPKPTYAAYDGRRLPATYANFLIINGAVLVPTYQDPADTEALRILTSCFPNHDIVPVNALPIIQWYGSIHCMTMQLPIGVIE